MAVGKADRGSLWVDGQFTVRLRGPGPEPGRIVRIRRPFALIGQIPGADIRIDDPSVDGRHALLLLDRRGIFGVDLLSRTGTRFAGAEAASAWLGAGDILEIAGRRVELLRLLIDGSPDRTAAFRRRPPGRLPRPGRADPRAARLPRPALDARLRPGLRRPRGRLRHPDRERLGFEDALRLASEWASSAYVIDLLGRRTLVNERAVEGASVLLDGDVLTVGQARFAVKLETPQSASPLPLGEGPGVRGVASSMARTKARLYDHSTCHDPHPGPLPGGEGARSTSLATRERG